MESHVLTQLFEPFTLLTSPTRGILMPVTTCSICSLLSFAPSSAGLKGNSTTRAILLMLSFLSTRYRLSPAMRMISGAYLSQPRAQRQPIGARLRTRQRVHLPSRWWRGIGDLLWRQVSPSDGASLGKLVKGDGDSVGPRLGKGKGIAG